MLSIKTFVANSEIHGLGCFADEDVAKGAFLWEFTKQIDIEIPDSLISELPEISRNYLLNVCYRIAGQKGEFVYVLCADNARYMNHSETPNIAEDDQGRNYAIRDIRKGEEITCDYRVFDLDFQKKQIGT